jgi:hypothetical protein
LASSRFAGADDVDELVEIRQGDEVTFQNSGALLGLLELEARAAQDDFAAVLDVALDDFLEIERLGAAMIDGQRVDAEEVSSCVCL